MRRYVGLYLYYWELSPYNYEKLLWHITVCLEYSKLLAKLHETNQTGTVNDYDINNEYMCMLRHKWVIVID